MPTCKYILWVILFNVNALDHYFIGNHIEFCTVIHCYRISLTVCDLGNASERGLQSASMSLLLLSIIVTTLPCPTMYKLFLKTVDILFASSNHFEAKSILENNSLSIS